MSTRAIVRVFNKDREFLCGIYQHGDGYVEGLGQQLGYWLYGREITNGICYERGERVGPLKQNNGMECLAAELVSYLKVGRERDLSKGASGNVYLYAEIDSRDNVDAAYTYDIFPAEIIVRKHKRVIYAAPWDAFVFFAKDYKHE